MRNRGLFSRRNQFLTSLFGFITPANWAKRQSGCLLRDFASNRADAVLATE